MSNVYWHDAVYQVVYLISILNYPRIYSHYFKEKIGIYTCNLFSYGEADDDDKKLIKKYSTEFHTALDNVKICDPAIGSGAFPMGLLHEIFTAKQTLHTFEHGNTKTFDASGVKLNIIQNSIYGVDIEKGAVDIARLRFWLSLIVDEEKPQALPNLDYKIVVGNSLVSKLDDDIIKLGYQEFTKILPVGANWNGGNVVTLGQE